MKVYSISRWAFIGICAMILVLPVSRNWKLLLDGENARGVVGPYRIFVSEHEIGEDEIEYASSIEFHYNGELYTARGPANLHCREGREIRIRFDPEDPARYCLLTFSGLYLNNYSILPLFLLTVWAAFYLSFNNYQKKRRVPHHRQPARSPYQPFDNSSGTRREKGPRLPGGMPGISPKDS